MPRQPRTPAQEAAAEHTIDPVADFPAPEDDATNGTGELPPVLPPGPVNLYSRMAAAMAEISRVRKAGRNTHFNYTYATEADIMDVVRPVLARHGICVFPSIESVERIDIGAERAGPLTRVLASLTFASAEGTFTIRWAGDGQDPADKGLYKAMTGLMKYAILKTMMVSTGDDVEQDSPADEEAKERGYTGQPQAASAPPASDKQLGLIRGLSDRLDMTKEQANAVAIHLYHVPLEQLDVRQASGYITNLKAWQEAGQPPKELNAVLLKALADTVREGQAAPGTVQAAPPKPEFTEPANTPQTLESYAELIAEILAMAEQKGRSRDSVEAWLKQFHKTDLEHASWEALQEVKAQVAKWQSYRK